MVQVSGMLQGPPGTGKTRTILGLLSVALHAQPAVQRAGISDYVQKPVPAEQLARLSIRAAPWLHGLPSPRWVSVLRGSTRPGENAAVRLAVYL